MAKFTSRELKLYLAGWFWGWITTLAIVWISKLFLCKGTL